MVMRSKSEGARRAERFIYLGHTPLGALHVHMTSASAVIGHLARECLLMREGREGGEGANEAANGYLRSATLDL